YGDSVTYEEDRLAHVKTEFGFDVLEVAHGRYAPDSYHDFIGFGVSAPLLEQAFQETYGLVDCRKVTITSCYASKLVWRQTAKYLSPATNVRNSAASLNRVPCRPATSFAPSSS